MPLQSHPPRSLQAASPPPRRTPFHHPMHPLRFNCPFSGCSNSNSDGSGRHMGVSSVFTDRFNSTGTGTTSSSLPLRPPLYHSHQHAPPPPPFNNAETAILFSALNHVPEYDFSDMALTLGARDTGYHGILVNLFPRSPLELIIYHLVNERLNLHKRVDFGPNWGKDARGGVAGSGFASDVKEMEIGWKIRIERIRANESHWQEIIVGTVSELDIDPSCTVLLKALAIMALPSNIPTSIAELVRSQMRCELFMTQDKSHDFASTWDFLDRRLRDVKVLGDMESS
ncbi:hypothetical protein BDZ91DRAFT_779140 [Kalaharituber pfeilii]|nr:hypothetical protein BDZ91DRAFT_779140 [Kalaharituber pfeilii]